MHIVHVCQCFNTKIEYQELALVRQQIKIGHKVTVVTSDWHIKFLNYEETYKEILGERYIGEGEFFEEGIKIIRLKLIEKPNLFLRLKNMQKVIKKLNPDLIFCHNGFEYGFLGIQSSTSNSPLIIDSHFTTVQLRRPKKKNTFKKTARFIFLKFKLCYFLCKINIKFIGVTEDSVERLHKLGIPNSRILLIPLAADIDNFYFNKKSRITERKKLKLKNDDILLCYTGKIEEDKGVHLILKALKILNQSNIYLIIVGTGSSLYHKKLIQYINNNLNKNVFFINFVDKTSLNRLFCASDIAVYPKSITISHIEAMSVGLPIIVEKLNSVKHRLEYNNGFTVKCDDIYDLANKINILYKDKNLREKMGKRGRKLVEDKLNWKIINEKILSLYNKN